LPGPGVALALAFPGQSTTQVLQCHQGVAVGNRSFIGASKYLATLTITGVKNTQNMLYTKSPPWKWKMKNAFTYE